MRQRFLPILFLAALLGCSKSDSNPSIDFGPNDGISYRNASNMPSGTQDPTDWTIDGDWNAQEQKLFASLGANLNTSPQGSATYITRVADYSPAWSREWAKMKSTSLSTKPAAVVA